MLSVLTRKDSTTPCSLFQPRTKYKTYFRYPLTGQQYVLPKAILNHRRYYFLQCLLQKEHI